MRILEFDYVLKLNSDFYVKNKNKNKNFSHDKHVTLCWIWKGLSFKSK